MASNTQAATATSQSETSPSTTAPIHVYIVSYNAQEWSDRVTLLDGSRPLEDAWGSLNACQSLPMAQDVGIEWALKQLQDHLNRYSPPLETEKDRDDAFDEWAKSESKEGETWCYVVSKGDDRLVVKVQEIVLYDPYRSESD